MNPERGTEFPEQETETYRHPELHEPYPDRLLVGLTSWQERFDSLSRFSAEELAEVDEEVKAIEQEHLEPHRISLDSFRALGPILQSSLEQSDLSAQKRRGLTTRLDNMLFRVERAVAEYGDNVRQHVLAGRMKVMRPEQADRLLTEAYHARGKKHELLIDALQTLNTLVLKETPNDTAASGFPTQAWMKQADSKVFPKIALSTQGKKREDIGAWALDMDIVEKSRAVKAAVEKSLEEKTASGE